jgi:hypothetical protein
MDEISSYLYAFAPVCWALLNVIGGLVATISPHGLRQARIWFLLSAIPAFVLPIAFGWTARSAPVGIVAATISAFVLGMIYYAGISILDEYVKHADKTPKGRDS